jgi:O-antigen ligase
MLLATLDRVVIGGILFLLLFTPLAFGSVHPWAYALMEATIFLLVMVWMAKLIVAKSKEQRAKSGANFEFRNSNFEFSGFVLSLALFLAFVLFQLLPLPPSFLRVLSPSTYELYSMSLPGWPERAPYAEHGARSRGQVRTVRGEGLGVRGVGSEEQIQDSEEQGAKSKEHRSGVGEQRSEARGRTESPDATNAERANATDAANQRSEVSSQVSDVTGQKSDLRSPTSDVWRLLPQTWRPLSISPALTRADFLKFTAYGALFFLILLYPFGNNSPSAIRHSPSEIPYPPSASRLTPHASGDDRFFRSILLVVILSGLIVASLGFIQRFSWNGMILWFFVPYDWGAPSPGADPRASGPFVSPDTFANYLSLVFPIAVSAALFGRFFMPGNKEKALRILCGAAAFIIFSAILLSLSRGAWIGALLATGILLWFSPWGRGQGAGSQEQRAKGREENAKSSALGAWPLPLSATEGSRGHGAGRSAFAVARVSLIVLCVLIVASLFFVGPGGRQQVDLRLEESLLRDIGLAGRTAIWRDSIGMVRDFPLFGVGLGAWPEIFPRYQSPPWSWGFYREAHNDYLELLAETGTIGFALLAWFFWVAGRRIIHAPRASDSSRSERTYRLPVLAALLAAIGAMAFHEFIDFSLQIPANALLFTLLLALALRLGAGSEEQRAKSKEQGAKSEEHGAGSRTPGPLPFALGALTVFLFWTALMQEMVPYPHNLREPGSVAEARDFILAHPAQAAGHVALGRIAGGRAAFLRQVGEYEIAVQLEPANPYIRDLYASALLSAGRRDEGLREITASVFHSPSLSTHFYLSEGLVRRLSETEEKAVEAGFKKAVAGDFDGSLEALAGFYERRGRLADLARLHEEAAEEKSGSRAKADLLMKAAAVYVRVKDKPKAEALLFAAASLIPDDPGPYRQLVTMIHAPAKDFSGAARAVEKGIQNGADPVSLLLALAEAAHLAGDPSKSREILAAARQSIPESARDGRDSYRLYLALADAARRTGAPEEEKEALTKAVEIRPSAPGPLSRVAHLHLQERNFDRAAFYLGRITRISPNSADVYYLLGVAEEGRYQFAAADQAYARAVALAPDNGNYRQRYEAFKARVEENVKQRPGTKSRP